MAGKETDIDQTVRRILKTYRQILDAEGIEVSQMLLFGSHSRQSAHEWSDIDVAVISPSFGEDYFDERVRLMKIALRASSNIEPHPLHPRDLQDRWSTLAAEIRRYGIEVEE